LVSNYRIPGNPFNVGLPGIIFLALRKRYNINVMKKYLSLLSAVGAAFLLCGCVDLTLKSSWKDREILIDGKDAEWGRLTLEKNVSFGARNDDEYLYLCLSATDKGTKSQLMGLFRQDLYVWIDPQGKKSHRFGLRLSNGSAFMDEALLSKIRYMKVQEFQVIADEMMNHMTINVISDYLPYVALSEAKGIDVGVGVSGNGRQLTYELKLPLRSGPEHPYAIDAVPGKPIQIGLETTPLDIAALRKEMGLDVFYGMESSAGREAAGGNGRRPAPVMTKNEWEAEIALETFRPIKVWCGVWLAQRP
jgi:hypothetical protein